MRSTDLAAKTSPGNEDKHKEYLIIPSFSTWRPGKRKKVGNIAKRGELEEEKIEWF